ncbi:MAG: Hemagglutinin-like protein, partial [Candidatus Woesebacteria bacterium GW2011_GWA1_38_8]
ALAPYNTTLDLLVGSNATASATFAVNALTGVVTAGTNNNLTFSPAGTGDTVFTVDGDTNFQITESAAPAVDMAVIDNTGNATVTDGVDSLSVTMIQGESSGTNAAIHANVTGSGTAGETAAGLQVTTAGVATGTLYGITIDAITGSTGDETALNIGTGWDQGLTIADANTNAILLSSTDGDGASGVTFGSATPVYVYRSAAGELTISDSATAGSGNYFQFDTVNGPTYAGTARPSKQLALSPEFGGAVLTTFYGAGTDTNVTGTMTSDAETAITSSANFRTYYQWLRTQSTMHYYTVAVRVALPQDFSGWTTDNAITIEYLTETTNAADNTVSAYIYNETNATQISSDTDNVAGTANTWGTQIVFDDSVLDAGSAQDWDAAAETAIIYIRMGSNSGYHAKVGDIKLNYYARF